MTYRVKAALVMLLLWIASSAAAFYWLFLGHFGVFDEEGLWQQKPLQPVQVQAQFSQLLRPESAWQAVLITEPGCSCSSFASDHLRRIQKRQSSLRIEELDLAQAKALGLEPIATPLLLLFQHQQLLYAGPLATDLLCSENASLLDGIIESSIQLPGFWLNGESTACRCVTDLASTP